MAVQKGKIPILLTCGAIASLCLILLTLFMYRLGPQSFVEGIAYLGYAIVVVAALVAGLVQKGRVHAQAMAAPPSGDGGRLRESGLFRFRAALRVCFGVIAFGLAVQTLFTWVLLNVIDPHFKHTLIPVVLAKTEAVYRRFGMPDDQLAATMADERASDPFGPGRTLLGLARNYVVGFVIALVLAAIIADWRSAVKNNK
jgi:Protein of unknown function (DUF4199)